ncbi:phage head closure protein [Kosakonia sacchari]|uniref:phage head closure protein n=1 Tax=Kosakonia sacchari TaxID=1158459 RepID=UPI002ACEEBF1|nr:phage head closure protein [Kosakonia sacchari]MDZ7322040.1 phage head closure protein [Kosakonia sacchari]
MQAGRLNKRIAIMNFTTVRTDSGQPDKEWHEVAPVWAEIKGISGREQISAGAEMAEATIRVWVRFRTDITAASKLKVLTGPYKGQILDVAAPPIADSKGSQLEILCKQGVKP